MSKIEKIRLCILGTGFSGTAALFHLVNRLLEKKSALLPVEIITIEERPVNGPGFPYAPYELLPSHLCNNEARMMSLQGNDFCDWMNENRVRLAKEFPLFILETHPTADINNWKPAPEAFYPRALFGVYLMERFEDTLHRARDHGIEIETLNGFYAIDGYRKSSKFNIVIKDVESNQTKIISQIDKLLLSTGHWVPARTEPATLAGVCIDSPYPYAKIRFHIDSWAKNYSNKVFKVFVKGMGPSGIDAIMSLSEPGKFRYSDNGNVIGYMPSSVSTEVKIVVGSRCGFFPAVRGETEDYHFRYLTEDTFTELEHVLGKKLNLDDILSIIDAELKNATSGRMCWQDVLAPKFRNAYEKLKHDALCPKENNLMHTILLKARRMKFYRHLNEHEKEKYDRELDTHFIRIAVPIPLQNAEKLIALFESGKLESVKMGYKNIQNPTIKGNLYQVIFESGDIETSESYFDALVLATGQDFRLSMHPSPLISSLVDRGELLDNKEGDYFTGGVMLDGDESYCAMCLDPKTNNVIPSPHIASFGVLTRYWQNERNYSAAFVAAAMWWSEYCFQELTILQSEPMCES